LKGFITPDRGNALTLCPKQLEFSRPVNLTTYSSIAALDDTYFQNYGKTPDLPSGYVINQLDLNKLQFDISVYYNKTLTSGSDLPLWISSLAQSFVSLLTPGIPFPSLIAGGIKNFPSDGRFIDFDLISFIGPFLYVFLFQLTFPVILGVSV
jgi:hypothetical protein